MGAGMELRRRRCRLVSGSRSVSREGSAARAGVPLLGLRLRSARPELLFTAVQLLCAPAPTFVSQNLTAAPILRAAFCTVFIPAAGSAPEQRVLFFIHVTTMEINSILAPTSVLRAPPRDEAVRGGERRKGGCCSGTPGCHRASESSGDGDVGRPTQRAAPRSPCGNGEGMRGAQDVSRGPFPLPILWRCVGRQFLESIADVRCVRAAAELVVLLVVLLVVPVALEVVAVVALPQTLSADPRRWRCGASAVLFSPPTRRSPHSCCGCSRSPAHRAGASAGREGSRAATGTR